MAESSAPKNAIWIFGDQHPPYALGCNGSRQLHTPNLDTMANFGVNMTRAVGGFPLCCPFRGSLLTSRYPHECVPGHEYQMPPEMKTVAHAFRDCGYHTAYYGKWHVDGFHERDGRAAFHHVAPERRGGFNRWLGFENNNSQWDCWVHGHDAAGAEVEHYRLPGYETDCLTDLLIDFLKEQAKARESGAPFFAVLSVQPPHNPYVAPEEWMRRHTPGEIELRPNVPQAARYREQARRDLAGAYAQIENLDWNVGRVRQALMETGLLDDTNILFFADHGDMHGSHGQFKKTTPYHESLGIPFIISGGRDQYESHCFRCDIPINHVDIAPTTLGLCGLDVPEWMRGTDYSGLRRRDRSRDGYPDSAYIQSVIPTGHGGSVERPWRGVVSADGWKYACLEGQPWMLFDMNEDPYEEANHALDPGYRAQRQRLQGMLARWIEETGDSFPLPED